MLLGRDDQQNNPEEGRKGPEMPILDHLSSRMMVLASRATSSQALAACAAASASAGVMLVVSQDDRRARMGMMISFFMGLDLVEMVGPVEMVGLVVPVLVKED